MPGETTYEQRAAERRARLQKIRTPKVGAGTHAMDALKGAGEFGLGLGQMLIRGPAGAAQDMANEFTGHVLREGFGETMSKSPINVAEGVTGIPFRDIREGWKAGRPAGPITQGVLGLALNVAGGRAIYKGRGKPGGAPPPTPPPAPEVGPVRPRTPPVRTMPVASHTTPPVSPPPAPLGPVTPIETPRPIPEAAPPKKAPVKKAPKPEAVARPFKLASDKELTALANRGNKTAIDEIAFRTTQTEVLPKPAPEKPPVKSKKPKRASLKERMKDETGAVGPGADELIRARRLERMRTALKSAQEAEKKATNPHEADRLRRQRYAAEDQLRHEEASQIPEGEPDIFKMTAAEYAAHLDRIAPLSEASTRDAPNPYPEHRALIQRPMDYTRGEPPPFAQARHTPYPPNREIPTKHPMFGVPDKNFKAGQPTISRPQVEDVKLRGVDHPLGSVEWPPTVDYIPETGQMVIADGHHRMTAALETGKPINYNMQDWSKPSAYSRSLRDTEGPKSSWLQDLEDRFRFLMDDETGAVGKDISDIQRRNKARRMFPNAEEAVPEVAMRKYGKDVKDLTPDEYWTAYEEAMDSAQDLVPLEKPGDVIDLNAKPGQKQLGPVEPVKPWWKNEKGSVSTGLITGRWKRKPEGPHMKPYRGWVNYRNAASKEGQLKGKEFKDLDPLGGTALTDFRKGQRSGRLKDVQRYLDTISFDMSQEGVKPGFKKNYLFQIFDSPKQEILDVARRLKLRPEFTAQSVLDNLEIGESVGLKPKFQNMSDFLGWYEKNARLAIADRMFFNNLKSQGLIKGSRKAPADWKSVDPDLFPIRSREGFKAPPDVAATINNYLRDPADLGAVSSVTADAASLTKNMVLSSGAPGTALNMHGVNITVRSLLNNGPLRAMGTIARLVNTGAEGKIPQTIEKLAPWKSARAHYESIEKLAPKAMKHGLTLTSEEHRMNTVGSTHLGEHLGKGIQNMPGRRGQVARAAYKPVEKGLNWILQKHGKYFEDPLFRNVIPDEKLTLWKDLYKDFLKKGLPEEEAGRSAAELANDAYGGINWEAMGNSRDFQNVLRSLVLAPDWFRTNLRTMKGMSKAAVNPKAGESRQYAYMVRNLLGAYIAADVANKLSTGHHMWENDPGHKLQIQMGKSGTKNRYLNPFATAVDFFRLPLEAGASAVQGDLSQGPKILMNRASTLAHPAINMLKNTDDFGRPLGGKDAYGRPIGLGTQAGNYLGEVSGAVTPAYVGNPIGLLTGKHENVEQALMGAVEAPVRYAKPSQKGVRKRRARSR